MGRNIRKEMENSPSGAAHSSTAQQGRTRMVFRPYVGKNSPQDASGLQKSLWEGCQSSCWVRWRWWGAWKVGRNQKKHQTETPGCAAGETLGLHGIIIMALHDLHHVLTPDVLRNPNRALEAEMAESDNLAGRRNSSGKCLTIRNVRWGTWGLIHAKTKGILQQKNERLKIYLIPVR